MPDTPVILQIIPRLDTGGAERTVIEVAEAVTRAGGKALVAAEGGRLAGELEAAGGELIPFPAGAKNPLTILANARRLERLIAARGVSLVHARSRAPAWSALLAARRARVPFVTTYHGVYNQRSAIKSWYNSVMARGDVVIANSHYTAGIVAARHGTPGDRLTIIHRGVDLARFDPGAVSADRIAALRASWGVDPRARLVVQAARLTRWKGQHVIVGAAARLKEDPEFGDVVFILAGDDQGRTAYAQELADRIEALGLAGRVRLTGHCDDVPAAFLTAAAAVVASIEPEAFGRASAEAQAMGCPVIVSDLGALPETLAQGGNGGPARRRGRPGRAYRGRAAHARRPRFRNANRRARPCRSAVLQYRTAKENFTCLRPLIGNDACRSL
jgi:glycosyltransferase involved in cell wall biosynthesis